MRRIRTTKSSIEIENGKVKGEISERALRLILEWLDIHRDEMMKAWEQASNGLEPDKIEPLK